MLGVVTERAHNTLPYSSLTAFGVAQFDWITSENWLQYLLSNPTMQSRLYALFGTISAFEVTLAGWLACRAALLLSLMPAPPPPPGLHHAHSMAAAVTHKPVR